MIIDICEHHAEEVMRPFDTDHADRHGYLDELHGLDLHREPQAVHAIRSWLLPATRGWSNTGRYLRREACRFQLMRGQCFSRCWLPGLSDLPEDRPRALDSYPRSLARFQLLVWREIFPELPYRPMPAGLYRHRVDIGFYRWPDTPQAWGLAEYRPW